MARDTTSDKSQPRNAWSSMLVTEIGMVIEDKFPHPSKADEPMIVTVLGITVFIHPKISLFEEVSIMALQFSRLSNVVLLASTSIVVILKQQ